MVSSKIGKRMVAAIEKYSVHHAMSKVWFKEIGLIDLMLNKKALVKV